MHYKRLVLLPLTILIDKLLYFCTYTHTHTHTFSSNACQFHSLFSDELKGLANVGNLVYSHLPPLLSWRQLLSGNDLQQTKEVDSITEILVEILDLDTNLPQVRVAPCCEGLNRHWIQGFKDI